MLQKIVRLFLLTLAWPLLQLLVFFFRFHRLPLAIISGSLVFLSFGFLSAFLLLHLLSLSRSKKQKRSVVIGYLVAIPFAMVSSLLGGLVFIPELGVTAFGLIPLCIGLFVGYFVGKTKKVSGKKR